MTPRRRRGGALVLIALVALEACAGLSDTSLHVAFESRARRDGVRRVAVLTEDFYYCYPPTRQVFRVPRGFETDFASVPAWATSVLPPIGDGAEAAVVHDWLYAVGAPAGREAADAILFYGLRHGGLGDLQSRLVYEAVRAAGAGAYGRPSEWRFVDPETERPVKAPPKPASPVLAVLPTCEGLKQALPRLRLTAAALGR